MYELVIYPEARAQLKTLPDAAADALYSVLLDHVRNNPWDGMPEHKENPDGAVRRWLFGPAGTGIVIYLILEPLQRVDVMRVIWLG